ncbi:Pentatricopeptide repeat-containing protein [Drosera capensis]
MISKKLLCKVLVNWRPQRPSYSISSCLADRTQLFEYHFCTSVQYLHMTESSEDVESPDLPDWIKYTEAGDSTSFDSEDEFVLPKVAEWAETQQLYRRKDATSMVVPEAESIVDSLSRILKRNFESPDDVLEAISCYPIDLSETIVMKVLNRFSNDWIPAYGFFKWASAHRIFRHTADCYNMMVDILGKSREFKLMWDFLEEMKQLPGIISIVTLSKVIRRLSKAGRWSDVVEAFRNMERFGLSKDSEVMNIVMDALVKEKCVEKAHDVFLEFKDTIQPNAFTFNILIHGWCKARKFDKACLVMGNMEKDGFHPDIVSYTSFVEAYCKEKDFRRVEVMLDEMQKKGCPPNTMTYTIVMLALGKAKEMTKALGVYEKAREEGCHLDSSFYSALIFILNKSGRFKDAEAIFVEMSKQDVSPNVLAYNTMISAACMHSQEEDALGLLIEMEKKLCKPNLKTYAPLLKICCQRKRMKVLNYLLIDMFRKDVSPDAGTYTLLVNALSKAGKLEHACSFLEEMVVKGMVPMDSTIRLLLEKLDEKGMQRAKQQIGDLNLQANIA